MKDIFLNDNQIREIKNTYILIYLQTKLGINTLKQRGITPAPTFEEESWRFEESKSVRKSLIGSF